MIGTAARRSAWFDDLEADEFEAGGPDRVRWIQRALNQILGLDLAEDGVMGSRTRSAIRSFQSQRQLTVDGVVGPTTERALRDALAGSSPGRAPAPAPVRPSAPGPAPAPVDRWSSVARDERMRHVMAALVGRYGYPANGAAGLVGNLWAESALIPSRLEGSDASTPLRARDFQGRLTDFSPEQVMNRSRQTRQGPSLPGVGLAQWTYPPRRAGLFRHVFQGRTPGAGILFDMDAQIDYLVTELRTSYQGVNRVVTSPTVSVEAASDDVVYRFERPGSVIDRPRTDPQVQQVFATRRRFAWQALQAAPRSAVAAAPELESSFGSPADRVRWIQQSLNRILGLNLAVDGVIGSQTRSAIRSFQEQRGLVVDGIVGSATEQALQTASSGSTAQPPPTPVSSLYDRCSETYRNWLWQALRNVAGASLTGPSPMSRIMQAVKHFQAAQGLANQSGTPDAETEARLVQLGASQPPASASGGRSGPLAGHPVDTALPPSPGLTTVTAHRFGLPQTIRALQAIGATWTAGFPGRAAIRIGDVSRRGGGCLYPHGSHQRGVDVDIAIVRTNGSMGTNINSPDYSPDMTRQLIQLIRGNGVLPVEAIFFNDRRLIAEGLCTHEDGHDNHLHVRFRQPPTNTSAPPPDTNAPSTVRATFAAAVRTGDWPRAFVNLNGLNMFEMLRALHGLDLRTRQDLCMRRAAYAGQVNMPRIEYAMKVVQNRTLPATAPGDLQATGQVDVARQFLRPVA